MKCLVLGTLAACCHAATPKPVPKPTPKPTPWFEQDTEADKELQASAHAAAAAADEEAGGRASGHAVDLEEAPHIPMPTNTSRRSFNDTLRLAAREGRLYANDEPLDLKGVNWFGSEARVGPPGGLNSHSVDWYLDFLVKHRFNAIRLLFNQSPDTGARALLYLRAISLPPCAPTSALGALRAPLSS